MSLPDVTFRPVPPEDLDSVMRLEQSMPHSLLWESASKEDQMNIIGQGSMYGVYVNGTLIGKVGFWDSPDDGWEVDGMIVDDKYRNKKYGTQLLSYALRRITETEHPSSLVLYTHPHNVPAIILYLKVGFLIVGYVANKYGQGKDRLRMKRYLV